MPALKTEGLILRKYYLRETSYILVVFTKDFGKIRGVLKGARDPYPQFAGNFEALTKCSILFYKKKKGMDLITRCDTIDYFHDLRKRMEHLAYASYFLELADAVTTEYDPDPELYDTLVEAMGMLSGDMSPKRAARIFELKFLSVIGLAPRLEKCASCNSELGEHPVFSVKSGGALCSSCAKSDGQSFPVLGGTVNFMKKILSVPIAKTAHIKVSRDVGRETETILKDFIRFHVTREIKTLRFLDQIEKRGLAPGQGN